jgi:hypothetical protein
VRRTAVVEPSVICDSLRDAAEEHGLTFAPDPATHSRCTLGGMIANNSCGPQSVMAGKALENVEALEVLTYHGERFWVGPTPDEETQGDLALLDRMGARATHLDSGCCGMAGSFGLMPAHIGISKTVGELVLLPAVRRQSAETVILSNGVSCREQIRQGTGREVLHIAELLRRALDFGRTRIR